MIGASALAYSVDKLIAGSLSSAAFIAALLGLWKVYFYYELLEEALNVGEDVEKLIFKSEELKFALTHRLKSVSTRKFLGLVFFGWSIFLPFVVLAVLSLILTAFYFEQIITLEFVPWLGMITMGTLFLLLFLQTRRNNPLHNSTRA